jgi:peptidoglycan/LPS O-acetylase OafA/YrhL
MQKIKHLEGLRGIAALIVLFCHIEYTCFPDHTAHFYNAINNSGINAPLKFVLNNIVGRIMDGGLAVWIFWVMSAYVISISFFKKADNYNKVLAAYFSKRYFRLAIPVLFSILFAWVLLHFGLMFNRELAVADKVYPVNDWLYSMYTFEPNFFDAVKSALYTTFFDFQQLSSYNSILWTIQNEFLGSLFIFSLFGIVRHNSLRGIVYLITAIIVLALQQVWLAAFVAGYALCDYDFFNSASRYIRLAKIIEHKLHRYKLVNFILSIVFILFGYSVLSFLKIPIAFHKLILSIYIVYVCLRNDLFKEILSSKLPFFFGKISFSLYLIHLPVICSLTSFLILNNDNLQGKIFASLATITAVIILSFVFMKYIDKKAVLYANIIGKYFKKYTR